MDSKNTQWIVLVLGLVAWLVLGLGTSPKSALMILLLIGLVFVVAFWLIVMPIAALVRHLRKNTSPPLPGQKNIGQEKEYRALKTIGWVLLLLIALPIGITIFFSMLHFLMG